MIRRFIPVAAAAALVLAACATSTPYAPAQEGGYGYSETRLESDRFRVSFNGNSLTDRETVQNYLLLRAAELTLLEGYDWFTVVDREADTQRTFIGTADPFGPFSYRYFHPYYGWRYYRDPFWNDVRLREITRYSAEAEIRMGRGAKPGDANAYDARQVDLNLRSVAQFPTS